jgi:hypothetical protein
MLYKDFLSNFKYNILQYSTQNKGMYMNRWKQGLGLAVLLVVLSGCASDKEKISLQNKNAQQAQIIQQQQVKIAKLQTKAKRTYSTKRNNNSVVPVPKKNIKLKKVEDNNFSSGYMYPQTRSKPKPKPVVKLAQASTDPVASATPTTSSVMGKTECVAMIGQEKFDKYTQMFGSESASIKRCKMLKAMRN